MTLHQDNPVISNAGDDLLRITVVYAAVVVVVCRADGVRRPLLGPRVESLRSTMPVWGLRLFQFQLTAIYVATVFKKWPGDTWQDGEAALWALQLVRLERFPVPDLIASSATMGKAMTWGALGLEILLPFLLWIPRTRRWGIVLGVGMHLSVRLRDATRRLQRGDDRQLPELPRRGAGPKGPGLAPRAGGLP